MPICRALLKHGYSSFSLEILEYCKVKDLLKREDYYFKLWKPEYYISKVAGSPFLDLQHSEETKAKISASQPKSIKVEVLDLETNITTIYNTVSAAAKAIGAHKSSIFAYLQRENSKPYKKRDIIQKID